MLDYLKGSYKMRRDVEWFLLILIVIGLLTIAIVRDEVFPNYIITWSIRIIGVFIIIVIIALYRRKKLKNL